MKKIILSLIAVSALSSSPQMQAMMEQTQEIFDIFCADLERGKNPVTSLDRITEKYGSDITNTVVDKAIATNKVSESNLEIIFHDPQWGKIINFPALLRTALMGGHLNTAYHLIDLGIDLTKEQPFVGVSIGFFLERIKPEGLVFCMKKLITAGADIKQEKGTIDGILFLCKDQACPEAGAEIRHFLNAELEKEKNEHQNALMIQAQQLLALLSPDQSEAKACVEKMLALALAQPASNLVKQQQVPSIGEEKEAEHHAPSSGPESGLPEYLLS